MAIFIWDDNYKTGVSNIDKQHQKLVNLLNQLDESLNIGGDTHEVIKLLDELVAYTEYHFKEEEAFMHKHAYADKPYQEHQLAHQEFITQVKEAQQNCHSHPEQVTDKLLDFLVQWLINHILLTDKQMVSDILSTTTTKQNTRTNVDILQNNLYGALRESESRFKELADILPALIWISNAGGKRIFVNKQYLCFTGLSLPECLRASPESQIHVDDKDTVSPW